MYLRRLCLLCLAVALALPAYAAAPATATSGTYPIHDPLTATVVGTPSRLQATLPKDLDFSVRTLKPLVKRATPPTLRYARPLRYLFVGQDHPAPLAFVIAGTGDSALSSKCVLLSRALYQVGYSVACLPSPTSVTFMLGASTHPVPGRMPDDVHDLYRLMHAVQDDLSGQIQITGYALTGWSLGATEAAFLARRDARVGDFDFSRVLLINPAVSVWASVERMDDLLQRNLPGGFNQVPSFIAQVLGSVQQVFARGKSNGQPLRFDTDFLYRAYKSGDIDHSQVGAIVGLAFRLSLANMAFAADLLTRSGVIVPSDLRLGPYDDREHFMKSAFRMSFTDYINELLLPYWNRDGRHVSKATLVSEDDLHSIRKYLAHAPHIAVFTNADDPILDSAEVTFLRQTFGARARIRPYGGHMGNLASKRTIHAIQQYFSP